MQVSVAYTEPGVAFWRSIEVPEGCTVREAIERSGLLDQFPAIDLTLQKVGVFGKIVKLDTPLRPGDRVEVYRPIVCDPQSVSRRQSAHAQDEE